VKKSALVLSSLLALSLWTSSSANQTDWTEKKIGKVILSASKAAQHKRWGRAIKYGEQAVSASQSLDKENSPRYINLLKNLNNYYDKSGRLKSIPDQIKKTYLLSSENLGPEHPTTMTSRTLYYKLLIALKQYDGAIPLVLENIVIHKKYPDKSHKILLFLSQLYSLYAVTGQFEKEEETLISLLELNTQLFGSEDESNVRFIRDLANNYCRQKKFDKFNQLMKTHNLKYVC
jgi:tetratricopeptide (TPR) repeat protein